MGEQHSLDSLSGEVLEEKYLLKTLLGSGGMGVVYLAEQIGLGRAVAVKVLRRNLIDTRFEWFRTEAMAASRINHPHAIAIYDFGVTGDGIPYLVMEHLRGHNLTSLVESEPLSPQRITNIGAQVLSALDEAHACGVVHCDLTGDNVLVEKLRGGDDFAKVIDFGLARLFEGDRPAHRPFGTSEYVAPEQIRAELIDPRTDLYAVGILLYEMVVGRTPFAGLPMQEMLRAHLCIEPPAPHHIIPSCPVGLSEVIVKALSKKADDRFASADEMRSALLLSMPMAKTVASAKGNARQTLSGLSQPPIANVDMQRPSRRTTRIDFEVEGPHRELIGRENELARVIDFCKDGDDSLMIIRGARGLGKARLTTEAGMRMGNEVHFIHAGADPSGLQLSWYPILGALENTLELDNPTYDELAVAVARCGLPDRELPGLAEIFSCRDAVAATETEVRKREAIAAAIRTLLAARRRHRKLVYLFADVDRYDQPSLEVVEAIAKRASTNKVKILLTCERVPTMELGPAESIELEGLAPQKARELVLSLTNREASVPSALTIHSMTGGSPATIEQLAGWLSLGNTTQDAPSVMVDLVSVRIHRLPAPARRVLQAVAIHGTVAPRWLVELSLDPDEREALVVNDWTGLLVIHENTLTIPSELVADIITSCTPADVRRRLHRRAYDAWGERGPAGIRGHHAELCGELQSALNLFITAGENSIRQFDDPGAVNWYGRALRVGRELHSKAYSFMDANVVDTSVMLAESLRSTGEYGLASGVLSEAEGFDPNDRQISMIARSRSLIALGEGKYGIAHDHIQRAIAMAIRAGERGFLCQCYLDSVQILDQLSEGGRAIKELEQAIDILTVGAGLSIRSAPERLWRIGFELSLRYMNTNRYDKALKTAKECRSLVARQNQLHAHGRVMALLAQISDAQGEHAAALRYRTKALDDMRKIGDRRSTAELLISTARAAQAGLGARQSWNAEDVRTSLKLAGRLAAEIGWNEGVALSKTDD